MADINSEIQKKSRIIPVPNLGAILAMKPNGIEVPHELLNHISDIESFKEALYKTREKYDTTIEVTKKSMLRPNPQRIKADAIKQFLIPYFQGKHIPYQDTYKIPTELTNPNITPSDVKPKPVHTQKESKPVQLKLLIATDGDEIKINSTTTVHKQQVSEEEKKSLFDQELPDKPTVSSVKDIYDDADVFYDDDAYVAESNSADALNDTTDLNDVFGSEDLSDDFDFSQI